jgi:hypothetical protein
LSPAFSREFLCRTGPDGCTLGLAPTWLASHGIEREAMHALRLALAWLPHTEDSAAGACEAAGAALYLHDAHAPQASYAALADEFARIVARCVRTRASLPPGCPGEFAVPEVAREGIRAAASRAVAQALDELDDRYRPILERVNWRALAPALQSHAEAGFERAARCYGRSALARRCAHTLAPLAQRLHEALQHDFVPAMRVTVRVDPMCGELRCDVAHAS